MTIFSVQAGILLKAGKIREAISLAASNAVTLDPAEVTAAVTDVSKRLTLSTSVPALARDLVAGVRFLNALPLLEPVKDLVLGLLAKGGYWLEYAAAIRLIGLDQCQDLCDRIEALLKDDRAAEARQLTEASKLADADKLLELFLLKVEIQHALNMGKPDLAKDLLDKYVSIDKEAAVTLLYELGAMYATLENEAAVAAVAQMIVDNSGTPPAP